MKLFGELSKVEPQDDGTIKVWGYASSAEKDSDGEIVEPQAIKAAIPDYMKFGAVREMHKASAAGTAIEIDVQEDGRTFFGAHIVDPVAIKKVLTGVYKGFSIGGSILKRDTINRTLIKAIKLTEISLVDRPANPEAVFTMCKMDDGEPVDENIEKTEGEVKEDKSTEVGEADSSSGESAEAEQESTEKSESVEDLEKAGAKFSAKTKEALVAAQNALKVCLDALSSLGLDETEKSESTEDLAKSEALEKLSKLEEENKLLKADVENLTAENTLLKSQPETPKGVLKVVEKTDDFQPDIVQKSDDENLPQEGTEERAMYEMRKVFKTGGLR